jgi:hypothetical protein
LSGERGKFRRHLAAAAQERISIMSTKAITAAVALLALGLMTQSGFAQQGNTNDPMSNENANSAPNSERPNDPSADNTPAARAPASPQGAGQYQMKREGSGKATSGQDNGNNGDQN